MLIRTKAFLIIISIVAVITASVIGVSVFFTQTLFLDALEKDMLLAASLADEVVSARIDLLAANTARAAQYLAGLDEGAMARGMRDQLEFYDDFTAMAVFDISGRVLAATHPVLPPEGILASPYVRRALGGKTVITPTRFDVSGELVFRVIAPIDENRILAVTLPGLFFSDILSKFTIWETGSIYMVDSEGVLLASRYTGRVLERVNFLEEGKLSPEWAPISAFVDKALKNRSGGEGVGRYFFYGQERIGAYWPVTAGGTDWRLMVSAPIRESPVSKVQSLFILAAAMFFGLGLIAAFFASGSISQPFNRIQEQNLRLEELNALALSASEAKTQFLASMSHEMRTPLNAIIGLSELSLGDEDPSRVGKNLEQIYGSGLTLLGIVNDLLDISKIESGKFELIPAEYDFPSLINDTINLNMIRIGSKPIAFKLQIDETLPSRLYGDELRVKQIFNNLLSNAFKYTREGSVIWHISCQEDAGSVWLTSSVKDSGIGIKAEDREKLFDNYKRLDMRTNRNTEGTGLGLMLAKTMVELMDGSIAVESEYGKGSTFTIRIRQQAVNALSIGPKVAENLMNFHYAAQKRRRNAGLARIRLPYARVLVVDDMPMNLDVARGMLHPYGMQVDCVLGGREAVELIRRGEPRYDAIFMDHMMPGMDGVEALKAIREEIGGDYGKNIPVIVLTANAVTGNEEMFLESGFDDFLSKPIDIMRLDAVIHRWVRDKERERLMAEGETPERLEEEPAPGGSGSISSWRIEGIDMPKALNRFNGTEDVLLNILRAYPVHIKELLDRLRALPGPGEAEKLAAYLVAVHSAKGAHYGISADGAGNLAAELEEAARRGDLDFIAAHNGELIAMAEKISAALSAKFAEDPEKPKKNAPDPALLAQLKEACKNYRMDDIDRIMRELEKYGYETQRDLVPWLRERIDLLDFQIIHEKL
jgi:signal transduction histidine kinase/FixJ family two-component response regulator